MIVVSVMGFPGKTSNAMLNTISAFCFGPFLALASSANTSFSFMPKSVRLTREPLTRRGSSSWGPRGMGGSSVPV